MKVFLLSCFSSGASAWMLGLVTAATLPPLAVSIKCGTGLTEPCLGESDPRYDPDTSTALEDQAPIWGYVGGFYKYEMYEYDSNNQPQLERYFPQPDGSFVGPFSNFPWLAFVNVTIEGSRHYRHQYYIWPQYENQTGFAASSVSDTYGTSRFEKDGSLVVMPIQLITDPTLTAFEGDAPSGVTYPVGEDDRTLFGSGYDAAGVFWTETLTCLDEACSTFSNTVESYLDTDRLSHGVATSIRIDTAEEFLAEIKAAYALHAVPPTLQFPVPMEGDCLTKKCPTEEDWAEYDPNLQESPYQEPAGKVKPGVVAGFTVAGIILAVLIFIAIHVHLSNLQKKRYRNTFAQRIAHTISLQKSMKSLTPQALESEFMKIDQKSPKGQITKEALWDFLRSGNASVQMSRTDFEALWIAIDVDGNDTVDFLEFCAFLGECKDEFDEARATSPANRQAAIRRVSQRLSTRSLDLVAVKEEGEGEAQDA